jgi:CRP/FNR family transcriptional regulator, cyclic AMP receptor protein
MFFLQSAAAGNEPILSVEMLLTYGAAYKQVKKGEIIFREGQQANFFYVIETGKVKMYNDTEGGKEFIQGFFSSGESFGEPPVMAGKTYPASAMAMENATLLRLSKDNFVMLLKENPEVHISFTQLLANRLTSYGPEHRILSLLKQYKKHCGCPEQEQMQVNLTRQEIADMTGLRVETVIRTMKAMEEKGELTIANRKVLI